MTNGVRRSPRRTRRPAPAVFFDTARTDDTITYYQCYTESADVVKRAIRDMERGKDVSILGGTAKMNAFLAKILPHKLVMRVWCRQQKKPY